MTFTIDTDIERERHYVSCLTADRDVDLRSPVAVGWDLDSTVANTLHRQGMIPSIRAGEATWADYSNACRLDTPVPEAVALMSLLRPRYLQIAISSRDESAEAVTWGWARAHKIPLDNIHLRPQIDKDSGPGVEWKVTKINQLQDSGILFAVFFEDWPENAEAIRRETGVPVVLVNPLYPCLSCGSLDRSCPCGSASLLAGAH